LGGIIFWSVVSWVNSSVSWNCECIINIPFDTFLTIWL
jgi:hypothetical protein